MQQACRLARMATLCATTLLSLATSAYAEDPINYTETLSGDWNGIRSSLAEKGIDTEIVYKFDVMSNVSGGIREGTRGLDNLDIIASFDGEKLIGSTGTSALIHVLNNNGGRPEDLVGSAQGVDNIEVPKATAKLFQAWIQQNFSEDRLSLLAGIYALDSEFEVTETSGLFLHSTYGAGTDLSQSGRNGPPIFPYGALAVRAKVQPTKELYVQGAVLDGVPGDPDDPEGTHIDLNSGDGALVIAEAGYAPSSGQKLALGGWYYTEEFPDHLAVDNAGNPVQERSQGMYLIGELPVYQEVGSENQGLAAFARLGFADGDVNQFDVAWSTGVVYTGLFPTRDEGQLGLAISGVHNASKFKKASALAGSSVESSETALELTYNDNLTPWLSLQPDAQYIINPGTDPVLDNALVLGLRTTINF